MNNTLKNVIIFASGLAVGSLGTWLGVKKYYELKADLEVESVKVAFDNEIAKFDPPKSSVNGEITGAPEIDDGKVHLDGTKSSISKELNNKPPLTDYRSFFKGDVATNPALDVSELSRNPLDEIKAEEEAAAGEHPTDDEPMTDEEDAKEQAMYETHKLNEEHKEKRNNDPYEISEEDFEFGAEFYDKTDLLYYIADDLLVTAEGEIEDKETTVGDVIYDTDFHHNDQEYLYVRNDRLGMDFEIKKIFREYTGE